MFYDLRIPKDHSQLIVKRAFELNFNAFAFDQVVDSKNLKSLKTLNGNEIEGKDWKSFSRLTVILESNSNLQLSHLKYDIIAVEPTNEKAFVSSCGNGDVDLISLDFSSRLPFYIKSSSVSLAISKGIYFEICYSSAINDLNARKNLTVNSKNLIRATKGKNIIISSNAQNAMQLRGPCDLMNLFSIFGLNPDKGKAALSKNCKSLLLQAGIFQLNL